MPKISKEKIKKIKENILALLFSKFPIALSTSQIAKEIARDEEFIKVLLVDLKNEKLVKEIEKNYKRKKLWQLSQQAYMAYKELSKKP